jgi:hypothetical protein
VSIGRIRHRNLVRLLAYCRRKDELILLYIYIPTAASTSTSTTAAKLDWDWRFRVIRSSAPTILVPAHSGGRARAWIGVIRDSVTLAST